MIRRVVRWIVGPIVRRSNARRDAAMLALLRAHGRGATAATLANLSGWSTYQTVASLWRLADGGRIVSTSTTAGRRWTATDGGAR